MATSGKRMVAEPIAARGEAAIGIRCILSFEEFAGNRQEHLGV